MRFVGECIAVELADRDVGDQHQLVSILLEDDENWHPKISVSSHWLAEMIEQLQAARAYLETNAEKEPDGYGYRRKP